MPPSPEPAPVEDFIDTLRRSNLIEPDAIRTLLGAAPPDALRDAPALAEYLVRIGKLSHFQAGKLLEGTFLGLVLGPYQIVMPVGKGGMGTVYLARDSRSPRLLALKVLPPKKARASERLLVRFQREMEIAQRVSHPHLTRTYGAGVDQGVHYIAMEYIAGVSLFRLVHTGGPLSAERAARLFAQVADGLEYAHSLGLIHRDLKPSNVLITPRDQAKVLDLGLALIEGEIGGDEVVGGKGYVVGSMDYVPPEQTQDATLVDARADLYGLGCTMYFALTGQPPFPGGDRLKKIRRHRRDVAPPVTALNPLVPAGLSDLVDRLMAKKPEDRPQTAADVRRELLAWADGGSEPAVPERPQDTARIVAELEAEQAAEAGSVWDSLPPVKLSEAAKTERAGLLGWVKRLWRRPE